jgi:acetyl esterase/lipase
MRKTSAFGLKAMAMIKPANTLLLAAMAGVFTMAPSASLTAAEEHQVINIWPGVAPGSENWTQKEVEEQVPTPGTDHLAARVIRNVVTPTLTVYQPPAGKDSGTALIVCPGGGYFGLVFNYEGTDVAEWLAARGITAFVLKYRVTPTSDNMADRAAKTNGLLAALQADFDSNISKLDDGRALAIADGKQAIRYVRKHAGQWHVAGDRIGIMGFSAGAGLTMGVILDHDAASHPDFAAPIYGYMDDNRLPQDAPPIFIVATQADGLIPSERSVRIYQKWIAANVPAELHLFAQGTHGFALRRLGLPVDHWPELFENWLRSRALLPPSR